MANENSRPVPDPTVLTTQQLLRENSMLKELLETRLNGMDTAIKLVQFATDKIPSLVDEKVTHLKELHTEKFVSVDTKFSEVEKRTEQHFDGIATQFIERDKRTEQLSIADKTAIAAALQAQKEAAGATNDSNTTANNKTETNFTKLIEQTQTLLQAVTRNTDEKINDLKSRLDTGEGKTSVSDPAIADAVRQLGVLVANLGTTRDTAEGRSKGAGETWGYLFGAVGMIVGAIGMIGTLVIHLAK
jgi:hypothetical protein